MNPTIAGMIAYSDTVEALPLQNLCALGACFIGIVSLGVAAYVLYKGNLPDIISIRIIFERLK